MNQSDSGLKFANSLKDSIERRRETQRSGVKVCLAGLSSSNSALLYGDA